MKNKKTLIAAAALFLSLIALFAAGCSDVSGDGSETSEVITTPEVTTEDELAKVIDIIVSGKSNYSLVRPDEADDTLIEAGKSIINNLYSYTGARLNYATDYVVPWKTMDSDPYEILLGKTNRPESAKALEGMRSRDYFIGMIGTKLVIAGTTSETTARAADVFLSKLLSVKCKRGEKDGSFSMCANENIIFTYTNYRITSCRLFGKNVSDFRVIYPNGGIYSAERYARLFASELSSSSGFVLEVGDDKKSEDGDLIVFGTTKFGGSDVAARHGYEIKAEGGKLYINAECMVGWDAALEYLTGKMFASGEVDIAEGFTASGAGTPDGDGKYFDQKTGEYRVIFNNILGNCDTSLYPTPTRNQMAAELHLEFSPDVIALQECSANSRGASSYIKTLNEHGYAEVIVKVTNSTGNNSTPLLYRTDVLDIVDSGYHLYDDGAGDNSKSVTWAVFRDKKGTDTFAVFSTHFYYTSDDKGNAARIIDAKEITDLAVQVSSKYGCAVIAGGDLNCALSSQPYQNLLKGGWTDAQKVAATTENLKSWHSYPEYNKELKLYDTMTVPTGEYSGAIDHCILYNPSTVKVNLFNIVTEEYALLSADHCPVLVDFTIN